MYKSEGKILMKKRYWYAVNLSSKERKEIRSFIKNDRNLKGIIILKAIKR